MSTQWPGWVPGFVLSFVSLSTYSELCNSFLDVPHHCQESLLLQADLGTGRSERFRLYLQCSFELLEIWDYSCGIKMECLHRLYKAVKIGKL